MGVAQSLADIIRQGAATQGQLGIQRAGIMPAAIGQATGSLQDALNQMALGRTRSLQNEAMRRTGEAQDIELGRAKRKDQADKELLAVFAANPDMTDEQRSKAVMAHLQKWDPQGYLEFQREAQKAAAEARLKGAQAEKATAEAEKARRVPPLIAPPGSGVGTMGPEGKVDIQYTQPFKVTDPRESTAGTGLTKIFDKGQGLRVYQFDPKTGRYDIDLGKPQPPSTLGAAGAPGMSQFVGQQEGEAVIFKPTRGGGAMTTVPLPKGSAPVQPRTEPTDIRSQRLAFAKAEPVINSISELSEKINTGAGLLAKVSGAVEKSKAQANYNDDVAEYEALVSSFTPLVARALGHVGVLTQQDVDSVRSIFPKPGDSKTLRDRKVGRLKGLIGGIKEATSEVGGAGKSGQPKVGDKKKFPNGNVGVWDGTGYVKQ